MTPKIQVKYSFHIWRNRGEKVRLRDLLEFNQIVVQCHDNPDADAIASGYAVYTYLKSKGKDVRLIYSGRNIIRKSNLVIMVKELEIPIEHVRNTEKESPAELLVTVDCQYGEGNVTLYPAQTVAVIDHHRVNHKMPALSEIQSNLGACATLLWNMLKEEGIDVNADERLATALYYGLFTDTGGMEVIYHEKDMELRDTAVYDDGLITKLRNANISIEELETAGAALLRCDYNEQYRFAVVKSGPCDPNVLGLISDMVLEVDAVDVCVVFSLLSNGVKLSIRSCIEEIKANELAAKLCMGMGSGGGHHVKAGGFLQMGLLTKEYEAYCRRIGTEPRMELDEMGLLEHPSMSAIKSFLEYRLVEYFDKRDDAEAVIFDLDGTLLNTLEDLTDAVNIALEKYNLPTCTMEEVQSFVGNGLRNLMLQAVEEGEEYPQFEELFEFFRDYYRTHCNIKTAPYEGIIELMKELKGRNIKMAIVSNKIDAGVKELNDKFFKDFTEAAIGEREGVGRKPAPDSVNEAIRILGVEKEHAIYVGDSDVDILTAKNADVRCISVTWGFRDEKFLMENGAGVMINRPLELLEYL